MLSIAAIILPIAAVMAFSRQPIGMVVTGLIMLWLMILFVPLLVPALPRVNDLELTPNGFGRMHSVLCRFARWDQVPFFNPTAGSALVSYNDGKIMVRDWIAALLGSFRHRTFVRSAPMRLVCPLRNWRRC